MGGGGDGGFGERQDAIDAGKRDARAALNRLFGHHTGGGVDRARFTTPGTSPGVDNSGVDPRSIEATGPVFDQAGYDAAVAAEAAGQGEADTNRAAMEALFGSTRQNAFDAGKRQVGEKRDQAARDLKFELFARGLDGGSVDADQNALLNRTYTQGLVDVGGKADTVANSLRGNNEQSRLQLLQSIDSGMDQSSALSSALGQMRVNSDSAAADAIGTNLGDLFAGTGLIYQQNRVAQGRQNAGNWWQQNAPQGGGRRGSGASGTTTFAG